MNASPCLVLQDVHKSFDKREVLKGIDLSVAEHEVVCLIGASGSGKSTLLRCINLIEPIDVGKIFVVGREVTAPGVDVNEIRRGIGIVFQSFNLFPHMTVLENVTLGPRTGSPAASSSALQLCARWRCSRSSCFSTRSRARSTRSSLRRC